MNNTNFDRVYLNALFQEWCANDIDMYVYLTGYEFSLDHMRKAK
jgi:hypothetical protein